MSEHSKNTVKNNTISSREMGIECFPGIILESLLLKNEFRQKFELTKHVSIFIGDSTPAVNRSKLFDKIRNSSIDSDNLTYLEGDDRWEFKIIEKNNIQLQCMFNNKQSYIDSSNFLVLWPTKSVRLKYLENLDKFLFLSSSIFLKWYEILKDRPLSDLEFEEFIKIFDYSPVLFEKKLISENFSTHDNASKLVPNSRNYFENLIGQSGANVFDFTNNCFSEHINSLFNKDYARGFLHSLSFSCHSAFTNKVSQKFVNSDDYKNCIIYISSTNDLISQLGLIDVTINNYDNISCDESKEKIDELMTRILNENLNYKNNSFMLLHSLFVLVFGNISRLRILSDTPPFYRRMASLSHASLLMRHISITSTDISKFCDRAKNSSYSYFYFQSLCDMRVDPRCYHNFIDPSFIKLYFRERIVRCLIKNKLIDNFHSTKNVLNITNAAKIDYTNSLYLKNIPGPIDGYEHVLSRNWFDNYNQIEKIFSKNVMSDEEFGEIINVSWEYDVDCDRLSTINMDFENYLFSVLDKGQDVVEKLRSISLLSAITRNKILANKIKEYFHKLKLYGNVQFEAYFELEICFVAAASHVDKDEWTKFIGNWVSNMCFRSLNQTDAKYINFALQQICAIEPDLWKTFGNGIAAISTVVKQK